ncbi:MAG: TolC family protein, partial [Pseudomonadota bacterium]
MRRALRVCMVWGGLLVLPAVAQEPVSETPGAPGVAAPPLTLEEVLASTQEQFPSILQALAKRRVAEGESLAALGNFDLVISAEGTSRMSGFWDGDVAMGKVTQPFRSFGGSVFGQYQLSNGEFPIYEDQNFTNTGGTAKAGVVLSLLRDRDIDARRFAEKDAVYALREADIDVLLTRVAVQQQAAIAYWNWVAAGQQMVVYTELLKIARDRDSGLIRQVASGATAAIFLTENQQNITRRRGFLTGAERDYELAVNRLAFYFRDSEGESKIPDKARLPEKLRPVSPTDAAKLRTLTSLPATIAGRPEVLRLQNTIQRAMQRLQLRENTLKPRLDLSLEVAEGFGSIAEGGASRDSTDTVVSLNFSVPLQRREATARVEQEKARVDALQFEQRQLEDQIDLELKSILLNLRYAEQLAELAELEVEQSAKLEEAELTRFKSGASDFFLVNLREVAVANARIKAVAAALATRRAQVNFDAATI